VDDDDDDDEAGENEEEEEEDDDDEDSEIVILPWTCRKCAFSDNCPTASSCIMCEVDTQPE
jgi:hypothetical protein